MKMLDPVGLDAHTTAGERQLERLTLKVADLQAENRALRRRLPESVGDMRRLRQAHRDAQAMLLHRFNGYAISRANCLTLGIPRRRWVWAVGLLKLARIHDGRDIIETDFEAATTALDNAFKALENAGTIARLRLRLPPSATAK